MGIQLHGSIGFALFCLQIEWSFRINPSDDVARHLAHTVRAIPETSTLLTERRPERLKNVVRRVHFRIAMQGRLLSKSLSLHDQDFNETTASELSYQPFD
jgi:hypothetical protein